MKTRVVFNQKGGVGKSTIACNLAAIGASQGLRTLVIDLDVQGNSTSYLLGGQPDEKTPTIADFFDKTLSFSLRPAPVLDFAVQTPFDHLHLIAASPRLDELQAKLEARHKIYKLREAIQELGKTYERIYIDTPPALNFYTRSALIAATDCLIPFDCDAFSRAALYTLLDNVREIQADHNPGLVVTELIDEGLPVLQPYLPASVKVRESHEQARPMVHLDGGHRLTQAFIELHAALGE
jgi:chromosome partitioning protein